MSDFYSGIRRAATGQARHVSLTGIVRGAYPAERAVMFGIA